MDLPFFFVTNLHQGNIIMDEDTSRHIISVLRMQKGEELLLTNGKGEKAKAVITDDHRKKCTVQVNNIQKEPAKTIRTSIGISLIKNNARFEWFLEKATEIGVDEIFPLLCERTEKEKFRADRLQGILTAAMLQSKQSWLPLLHEPIAFQRLVGQSFDKKFIAHCMEEEKRSLTYFLGEASESLPSNRILLIGPEGDFTPTEIQTALDMGYQPVSLGASRLRTETAGIVGAALLLIN